MEFLGIGPLELFFIILIALIVLGPKDMVKAGHTLGRLMRKTILSPTWLSIQRKIRNLPYEMMREAGLEESDLRVDIDEAAANQQPNNPGTPPPQAQPSTAEENVPSEWLSAPEEENQIRPPGPGPYPDSPVLDEEEKTEQK
ncbi:MAG: twin-arginine translocase TatA/TatE family subunit [Chloroflexota bacterium]|nr:MAG: twin-arginine translocase TatA/TatE family subunit [Chloroflexota bacterium]